MDCAEYVMKLSLGARLSARVLFKRRNLPTTLISAVCLGACIGAGVAVFGIAEAVLTRPLAGVKEPSALASLTPEPITIPGINSRVAVGVSYPTFESFQISSKDVFSELATYQTVPLNVTIGDRTARIVGQVVSENYFLALGMTAASGHFFTPRALGGEETEATLVIGHRLWRRLFDGALQGTGGKTLTVNGRAFEVSGVTPPGFYGTVRQETVEVWVPMREAPLVAPSVTRAGLADPKHRWLFWFFGRLQPGITIEHAQAWLDTLAQRRSAAYADRESPELRIFPYIGAIPGQREKLLTPVRYLSLAVVLLMLVVCTNTGGLLLVRLAARQGEIGIRLALGASRRAIIGQLMIEALLLTLLSGLVGLGVALGLEHGLEGLALGTFLPDLNGIGLDGRALAFAIVLVLFMAVVFGFFPGIWASRPRAIEMVRNASHRRSGRNPRLQQGLILAQLTVAVVLVTCAGLFVRTLLSLESLDLGFQPQNVVNLHVDLELLGYKQPAVASFYEELLVAVRSLPGIDAAALALNVPLGSNSQSFRVGGIRPLGTGPEKQSWLTFNVVSPGYFGTLGIPLIRGDDFSKSNLSDNSHVMIVNQEMARLFLTGEQPVGQSLLFGETLYRVIGVVKNVRYNSRSSPPEPRFYVSTEAENAPNMTLHVRSHQPPAATIRAITNVLRSLEPFAVFETEQLADGVRRATAAPRLLSVLFGGFGVAALILTAVGLYAILAYAVQTRNQELGVRMALGARPQQIVGLVVRQALVLTGAGLAMGLLAAHFVARGLATQLYGVTPTDSAVFATVTVLTLVVGCFAGVVPALAAARVDPVSVLRTE